MCMSSLPVDGAFWIEIGRFFDAKHGDFCEKKTLKKFGSQRFSARTAAHERGDAAKTMFVLLSECAQFVHEFFARRCRVLD